MSEERPWRKRIRILGACVFLLYMAGLIYFLFLSEDAGHGGAGEYDYNIQPFREIIRYIRYRELLGTRAVLMNLVGNVIGFMPFGALVPLMWRSARRAWRTTLLSFEISALVEIAQLIFKVGCFDVDDMILNALGGLIGYVLFFAASRCYYKAEQRRTAAAETQEVCADRK
ncbi:MAG: VanZ family protein [Lachnospiraceae bacterium]|nr:VanZ family protein [Lachnospiraceae bacterium]MCD7765880.1 VanZ family protein [Lachnospiraceae bacterium]